MTNQKTILVTGGTGFIASYLVMKLLEDDPNAKVVLFDRDQDMRRLTKFDVEGKKRYSAVKDRITFVQGDQSLLPHVLAVFDIHAPSSVFHLGALLSAGAETNPTQGFQVDAVGTWNLLEAARLRYHACPDVVDPIKVIFPSTIASFGSSIEPGQKVDNEAIQMPTTVYGVSKVGSERLGEYYNRQGWVDFRGVRFPSVIGASRGPGGTTVYSTLMVQMPAQDKRYETYVEKDTRLDVIYVKDAVNALTMLHNAPAEKLKLQSPTKLNPDTRVYNIAGIRSKDGQAPTASEIEAAVMVEAKKRNKTKAAIDYNPDPDLLKIVHTFGILKDDAAKHDWGWPGANFDLAKTITDFFDEVEAYPKRIKAIELFG